MDEWTGLSCAAPDRVSDRRSHQRLGVIEYCDTALVERVLELPCG
jgi:hypothetical protein